MNHKNISSPHRAVRCVCYGLFAVLAMLPGSALAVSEPVSDIRVIIDISGSMKKNDPKNLRAPALRMLVGLMPSKTKSGVWTFGKYVNMQVKHSKVSASWKKLAMQESKKIHSRGLFTNIEEALKRSTRGWETVNRKERRHLILLTDGMLDISKNQALNEASRKHVLKSIVPELKKAGVKIHTIALSKNADKKLLSAIAGMTDGWYEAVDNAEDLQRVFLRIFEKSANMDAVPLDNNTFNIDKSIKDMTVLVFRKPGVSVSKLVTPGKKIWSYKNHPANVNWYQDTGYDLISSKSPEVGKWIIKAAIDPDNRVMVVTNLKLVSGNFPNNIMYGDTLRLTAKLVQEGKTLTQERLLKLVSFNVFKHSMTETPSEHSASSDDSHAVAEQTKIPMLDDGQAADRLDKDGVYTAVFNTTQTTGDVSLTIQARSPAFEREIRHTIKVHDTPADLVIKKQADGSFGLDVAPRMELLVPHTISVQVTLPDGSKKTLQQDDDDKWHTTLAKEHTGKRVTVTLVGTRVNDKPFHADFDRILKASLAGENKLSLNQQDKNDKAEKVESHATDPVPPPPMPVQDEHSSDDDSHEKQAAMPADKDSEHADGEDGHAEGFDWLSTMMIIIYANIVLLLFAATGYILWRKRKRKIEKDQEDLKI